MVERCPTVRDGNDAQKREAKESSAMSTKLPPPPQVPQADTSLHQRLASLAPAPLLANEDPAAYDMLLKKVADTVKPVDFIEEIWVRDIVDHTWQVFRYRRLKAALLSERAYSPLVASLERYGLSMHRQSGNLTGDALMAVSLDENLDAIERIEQLTALAEARRIAALREIDRRRDVFAQRLRQAVRQVEDAEYKELEQHSASAH
jgi:hypothetical protein